MKNINLPPGQVITDRSFIVDYVASETGRLVKKVILDDRTEIAYHGNQNNRGLRTVLVMNDIPPSRDSDSVLMTTNISTNTENMVRITLSGDYAVNINWGDGYTQQVVGDTEVTVTHTYVERKVHQISIDGFADELSALSEAIVIVSSLGKLGIRKASFKGCLNLIRVPETIPESLTNIDNMFSTCDSVDVSSILKWDFSHIESMEGFLSFTSEKEVILKDKQFDSLTNFNSFFHTSIDCKLKLINCSFPLLTNIVSTFENSDRPQLLLDNCSLPELLFFNKLFFQSFTTTDDRGVFTVVNSELGLADVENFIYGAENVNLVLDNVTFPKSEKVSQLASGNINCDVNIDNLHFADNTRIETFVSDLRVTTRTERNSITVGRNTLGLVDDFYRLIDNIEDCDVVLDFADYDGSSGGTVLNQMIYSTKRCSIALNNFNVDNIDLTGILTNCEDSSLKLDADTTGELNIANVAVDCSGVEFDFSGSVFNSDVTYGTLAPGSTEVTFIESNIIYNGKVSYVRLFEGHGEVKYHSIDNKFYDDVYIETIAKDCGIDEILSLNAVYAKQVNIINILKNCQQLNEFKDIAFNAWNITGTLNMRTLLNFTGPAEEYDVKWFDNVTAKKVALRNWTVVGEAKLDSVMRDITSINEVDMERWTFQSTVSLTSMFSGGSSTLNLKRWTFKQVVHLTNMFANCNHYDRFIYLDSMKLEAGGSLEGTFSNVSMSLSLLSMRFDSNTSLINTFEYFGNRVIPAGKKLNINGLASWTLTHFVRIDHFMLNLGMSATISGLEGLLTWTVPQQTVVTAPFENATLPFEPPF